MKNISFCWSVAVAVLLAGCATQAPAPSATPAQAHTASDKFEVPIGYQKVMVNGEAHYCRSDVDTGSRITRTRVCYTMAQLEAEQAETQRNLSNQIQNANGYGTAIGAGLPTNSPGGH